MTEHGKRMVTEVEELIVGQEFFYIERGRMVGPFKVARITGARTPEHIMARGRDCLFEQYVPYAVYVEEVAA